MTPLTVTLFDDAPVFGGAERYLELLATGFDPNEVAPRVVLAREPELDPLAERLAAHGVPVARLPRVPTLSSVGALMSVFAHLALHRTRILHFNLVDPRACNGAIVAAKLAGHRAIVATNQLPQSPFDDLPTPRRHRVAMKAIRRHIVVSEANRADLTALGVPADRIATVHNATADPGPVTAARRAAARGQLGVAADAPIVGFAGRLVAQKNPVAFIDAAAAVAARRVDARFVVLGAGPEREAMETAARGLGIADRVAFLGHRADAPELFAGLDLLVFTSRYEGLPFAVLEAMGLGVPVVALRIPGMDEAVVDGVTGRLVEAGGAPGLAAAILDLLGRADVRAAMGVAARARALDRFSPREMVRKTVTVYGHLLIHRD